MEDRENAVVDFAETVVYSPSFLEKSFGGAIRADKKNKERLKNISFTNIDPIWLEKLNKYAGEPYFSTNEDFGNGNIVRTLWFNKKKVSVYDCVIQYHFRDEKSIAATYQITNLAQPAAMYTVIDPTEYVNAYIDLQKRLIATYKEPNDRNDLEPLVKGRTSALLLGTYADDAPYITSWNINNTVILLSLYFYKEKWSLGILYHSEDMMEIIRQEAREADNDGL